MSDYKRAFVLMPFREPIGSYYPAIFKPALEAVGYYVTRADDLFTPQPVMQDIQASILAADLILCEMSDRNPNVFYELGLAHAIGKPAILISRKADDIPFDLRHVRVILYDSTEAGWESKLREDIGAAAQAVVTSSEIWPPPLIDVSPTLRTNIPASPSIETGPIRGELKVHERGHRIRSRSDAGLTSFAGVPNNPVLEVDILFEPSDSMQLAKIELQIGDRRTDALVLPTSLLERVENHSVLFEVPHEVAHGIKVGQLWVLAGGQTWPSRAFPVEFDQ